MSKTTFHGKDGSQDAIIAALKAAGASVQDLSRIATPGVPDLLVGWRGKNYLLELKPEPGSKKQLSLRPSQVVWHAAWGGQVAVCHDAAQALSVIYESI
jgi:hypothetical protein